MCNVSARTKRVRKQKNRGDATINPPVRGRGHRPRYSRYEHGGSTTGACGGTTTAKWAAQHKEMLGVEKTQFKTAKRQELSALQKRVRTGKEQPKRRPFALERLMQRYTNVKNELHIK